MLVKATVVTTSHHPAARRNLATYLRAQGYRGYVYDMIRAWMVDQMYVLHKEADLFAAIVAQVPPDRKGKIS